MHFVVGLQVNEHVFFNPWKSQGMFFSSNSVKRPVNVDHMIFHSFWRHFLNLRRSKYSPFKSLREMISCLMRYAVCNGIHTHKLQLKSFDQTASVYFLGIFSWINYGIFGTILWCGLG